METPKYEALLNHIREDLVGLVSKYGALQIADTEPDGEEADRMYNDAQIIIGGLIHGTLDASLRKDLPIEQLTRLWYEIDLVDRLYRQLRYHLVEIKGERVRIKQENEN